MTKQEYEAYEKINGDYAIASLFFLNELRNIIKREKSARILEVGVGTGTVPYSLRDIKDSFEYVGTENFKLCIERLRRQAPFIIHKKFVREVNGLFDLIIVDGQDTETHRLVKRLKSGGIIVVENDRRSQVEILEKSCKKRKFLAHRKRPFSLHKSAGYTIFYFEPSPLDYWRFLTGWSWYKFKTHLQFRINKLRFVIKKQ
jgi:hypothetical protein